MTHALQRIVANPLSISQGFVRSAGPINAIYAEKGLSPPRIFGLFEKRSVVIVTGLRNTDEKKTMP